MLLGAMRLRRSENPLKEKSPKEKSPKLVKTIKNEKTQKSFIQRKNAEVKYSLKICRSTIFYYHTAPLKRAMGFSNKGALPP